MTDRLLTPEEFQNLNKEIKVQLEIDGYEVYVTDIKMYNDSTIEVKFFCKEPHMEEYLTPHVHDCIKKMIKEQECQSKKQSSPILSTIRNIFRK